MLIGDTRAKNWNKNIVPIYGIQFPYNQFVVEFWNIVNLELKKKSDFHKLHMKNRKIQWTKNYRMRKNAWFAHHQIIWIFKKIIYFWERKTCLNQPKVFYGFLDEKMWSNQKEKIIWLNNSHFHWKDCDFIPQTNLQVFEIQKVCIP
jgi:hypothetical protein